MNKHQTTFTHEFEMGQKVWIASVRPGKLHYCTVCGRETTDDKWIPEKVEITGVYYSNQNGEFGKGVCVSLAYGVQGYTLTDAFATRAACQAYCDEMNGGK